MRALWAKLSRLAGRHKAPPRPAQGNGRFASTDLETEAGAQRLQKCAAVWKSTPGLLLDVSGAGIAAIVRFREAKHDDRGFRLVIEVEEPLLVPEGLKTSDTLELGGDWEDASCNEESVNFPGRFAIYFGEEGVGRVRQFWAVLPQGKKRRPAPRPLFGTLQQCCRVGRPQGISEKEFEKRLRMFAPASGRGER